MVATDLSGYFLVARAVVPRLLAAGGGRVVNVSMDHATMNRKGFVRCGPARDGAEALSRIMAADLAGSPVTVDLLLPGGATPAGMVPEDLADEMRSRLLPVSVAAAPIRWLCSRAAPESTTSGSWRELRQLAGRPAQLSAVGRELTGASRTSVPTALATSSRGSGPGSACS